MALVVFFSKIPILRNCNREDEISFIVNQLLADFSLEKYNELDKIVFDIYKISNDEIKYIYEKTARS